METSVEALRQRRADRSVLFDRALRKDTNVHSIGEEPLDHNFVFFCGTFTSHGRSIHQPWMAKLRYLLRQNDYVGPIFLPDDRLRTIGLSGKDGVVWQNQMLRMASDIVICLPSLSHQEEVFTAATLGMLLARREFATEKKQALHIFDPKYRVECLQLRHRLCLTSIETHSRLSTIAKSIIRNQSLR